MAIAYEARSCSMSLTTPDLLSRRVITRGHFVSDEGTMAMTMSKFSVDSPSIRSTFGRLVLTSHESVPRARDFDAVRVARQELLGGSTNGDSVTSTGSLA